ncbi:MAG: hypothetical protein NVSMB65_08560 [Chloroflexota bacterium]
MNGGAEAVARRLWESLRRAFGGSGTVTVEIQTRRQGRLVRVPVVVRTDDVERLYRKRY